MASGPRKTARSFSIARNSALHSGDAPAITDVSVCVYAGGVAPLPFGESSALSVATGLGIGASGSSSFWTLTGIASMGFGVSGFSNAGAGMTEVCGSNS